MEQEIREKLAHNLKVERAKKNWTQEQLAESSNVSTKHVTKIETLKVTPSVYIVYKFSKALGVTIDDLLK